MGNASFQFLAFALLTAACYQLFRSVGWRKFVLLASSVYFLSSFTHDLRAFLPFVTFLVVGYANLRLLHTLRAWFFPIAIALTIICFIWLKKYSFLPERCFLSYPYLTVGLSYILFRTLHLIINAHNGVLREKVAPLQYLLYVSNFLTLVSGPIQTFPDFRADLEAPSCPRPSLIDIGIAGERIIIGFFKTSVLALILSDFQTNALGKLALGSSASGHLSPAIIAFAVYPFFLFCNFSGYMDIVIGVARLLSISLPENFNRPFSSESFIELWNRWHITLSEWLKTYVYTPLLMSLMRTFPNEKLEPVWAVLSFFVTFFLIGIWHGQTSAFVFFGFLQGLGVSMNKLYQILLTAWVGKKSYRALSSAPIYRALSRGLTFSWFAFSLIWFWSSWQQVRNIFAVLALRETLLIWLAIWLSATLGLSAWEALRSALCSLQVSGNVLVYSRYSRVAWVTALLVAAIGVAMLSNRPAPEMVYKTF